MGLTPFSSGAYSPPALRDAFGNFLLLLVLGFAACAQPVNRGAALPPGRFAFPTGVALTPEGVVPQRLLVVSSNTDLRFRSGLLQAFDRQALDTLVDEAINSCDVPGCPPVDIFDLSSALVGAVEIGDLGGLVAATALSGEGLPPVRAFVPVRGTTTVVPVDIDPSGIRCSMTERKCIDGGPEVLREDPFDVVTGLGNVYVGNSTLFRIDSGAISMARADDPIWTTGDGALIPVDVGDTAIGGLAVGSCRIGGDGEETCTLYANGRSQVRGIQRILAFDFQAGRLMAGPLFSRNLAAVQDGFDSRGIAIASTGDQAYLANRFPDALAVVDVTRIAELPSDSCVLPSDEVVPGGAPCPDLPPSQGERPRFANVDLIPAPKGPLTVTVIPRVLPSGEPRDLAVMTTRNSVAFFDVVAGALVADVTGTGTAPSDAVARQRDGGFRLYVPSFGRGTLAIIDLPDPFHPQTARLVARLGRPQEGAF